jgi:hypothetical protein
MPAGELRALLAEQLVELAQTPPTIVERLLERHADVVRAGVPQCLLQLLDPA